MTTNRYNLRVSVNLCCQQLIKLAKKAGLVACPQKLSLRNSIDQTPLKIESQLMLLNLHLIVLQVKHLSILAF